MKARLLCHLIGQEKVSMRCREEIYPELNCVQFFCAVARACHARHAVGNKQASVLFPILTVCQKVSWCAPLCKVNEWHRYAASPNNKLCDLTLSFFSKVSK
jgi:hypothetical protein